MSDIPRSETLRVLHEVRDQGLEYTPAEIEEIREDLLKQLRDNMDAQGMWYPEGDAELLDYVRHLLESEE